MIRARDLEWCAAFLEGEGSFIYNGTSAMCSAPQKNTWPLDKLKRLLGGNISAKPLINSWQAYGPTAAAVMMTLYPLLSPERQAQIRAALTRWRRRGTRSKYAMTCHQGHAFSGVEIVRKTGRARRRCRICVVASHRKHRHMRRLVSALLEAS